MSITFVLIDSFDALSDMMKMKGKKKTLNQKYVSKLLTGIRIIS